MPTDSDLTLQGFNELLNAKDRGKAEKDEALRQIDLEYKRELRDDGNAFTRGFKGGLRNTAGMFHGAVGAVQSLTGNKDAAGRSFVRARNQMDEAETYTSGLPQKFFSADDDEGAFGSPGNFGAYLAKTTGELVPFMAEVFLAGATGAAVGSQAVPGIGPDDVVAAPAGAVSGAGARLFGKRVLREMIDEAAEGYIKQGFKKAAAKKLATETVEKAVRGKGGRALVEKAAKTVGGKWGSAAGVIGASGSLETGGMWADGMREGYDKPTSAITLGLISGASELFLGNVPLAMRSIFRGPGGELVETGLKKVARKKGPRPAAGFLWDVAQNMGEEAAQEAFQEMLSSINQEINDPDFKITSKETFMQWAESAAAGALGGIVFGAPMSVRNAFTRRNETGAGTPESSTDMETGRDVPSPTEDQNLDPAIMSWEDLASLDERREFVRDTDPEKAAELDRVFEAARERLDAFYNTPEGATMDLTPEEESMLPVNAVERQNAPEDAYAQGLIEQQQEADEAEAASLEFDGTSRERRLEAESDLRRKSKVDKVLEGVDAMMEGVDQDFIDRNADLFEEMTVAIRENKPGLAQVVSNRLRKKVNNWKAKQRRKARNSRNRQNAQEGGQEAFESEGRVISKIELIEDNQGQNEASDVQESQKPQQEQTDEEVQQAEIEAEQVEALQEGRQDEVQRPDLRGRDSETGLTEADVPRGTQAETPAEAMAEPAGTPPASTNKENAQNLKQDPGQVKKSPDSLQKPLPLSKRKQEAKAVDPAIHQVAKSGNPYRTLAAASSAASRAGMTVDDVVEVKGGYALDRSRTVSEKPKSEAQAESKITGEAKSDNIPLISTIAELASIPEGEIYKTESPKGLRYYVRGDNPRGGGDTIHETLPEAQEQRDSNKAQKESEAKWAQRAGDQKRMADQRKADADKEKETIAHFTKDMNPIRRGIVEKVLLDTTIRFRDAGGKVVTSNKAQRVQTLLSQGYTPDIEQVQRIKDKSRVQWNRMDEREQREFTRKQKDAGLRNNYILKNPDGTVVQDISKTEYDYAKSLSESSKSEASKQVKVEEPAPEARGVDSVGSSREIEGAGTATLTTAKTDVMNMRHEAWEGEGFMAHRIVNQDTGEEISITTGKPEEIRRQIQREANRYTVSKTGRPWRTKSAANQAADRTGAKRSSIVKVKGGYAIDESLERPQKPSPDASKQGDVAESAPDPTAQDAPTAAHPKAASRLPEGWKTSGELATNPDPQSGGIVDKNAADKGWFAISNRENATTLEGYATRQEAIEALDDFHKKQDLKDQRKERRDAEKSAEDAELDALFGQLKKIHAEGRLTMGVDPDVAIVGTKIAAVYMKKGVRNFRDFAAGVRDNMGEQWDDVKKYLHSFWSGAAESNADQDFYDDLEDLTRKQAQQIISELESETVESTAEKADNEVEESPNESDSIQNQGGSQEGSPVRTRNRRKRTDENAPFLAGFSPEDVQGASEGGRGGASGQDTGGTGSRGDVRESGTDATDGRTGAGGTELVSDGAGGTGRVRNGNSQRSSRSGRTDGPSESKVGQPNYRITDPESLVGGGPRDKFSRNQAAIDAFQTIESEGRAATDEERDAMASYIGWGSFGQELFQGTWDNPKPKEGWADEDKWLRDHLGREAWESAQSSILNAHYTDPPTVTAMWKMVRKMGFRGGKVLEPAMGTGNFFGLMPQDLAENSDLSGIELDQTTGGIAKLLYPQASISIKGYQESQTPDGFYDLIIGNWPFAAEGPADRRYNKLSPTLHDYFFLKALDQVRPGGLVVGITSAGTMDKAGKSVRLEMSKKAKLVASYRLPTGAFGKYAGTKVVTDIIILQKKTDADAAVESVPDWVESANIETPSGTPVRVNKYYHDNPQNILGTLDYGHGTTTFRPGMIVHRDSNFEAALTSLPGKVESGIYRESEVVDSATYVTNNAEDRVNSVVAGEDGNLYISVGEKMVRLEDRIKIAVKNEAKTEARRKEIRALAQIRKALGRVVDAQRLSDPDTEVLRKELRGQYESYVSEFGPINKGYALTIFKKAGDPHFPQLAALERNTAAKGRRPKYEPATILTKSTVRGEPEIKNPTIQDAYVLQRNENLNLDLARITEMSGKTEQEVIDSLVGRDAIYMKPGGTWEHSDEYLSGNVRLKLREAKMAKENGVEGLDRNIAALEPLIPEDIPYFNIEAKVGAGWIPPVHYKDFIASMLGMEKGQHEGIAVQFGPQGWKVSIDRSHLRKSEASADFGHPQVNFDKLVQSAMRSVPVRVTMRDSDGNRVTDEAATSEANEKVARIKEHFAEWLWSDPERQISLETIYNDTFNGTVLPSFKGGFLEFVGMMLEKGESPFNLRSHQVSAIARGLILGRGIYAHEVGTGKTYTMGGIALESRRYGKAKKPLLFAHNANSATVAAEINEMYPGAKVLYVDNLSGKKKETTLAQIVNDDWDLIVVPHSMADRFALRTETYDALAAEEIAELEAAAIEAAEADGAELNEGMMDDEEAMKKVRSPTAKEMVRARNKIKERIKKMSQKAAENAIVLEDAGIDMIMVDEAHMFKKPPIATSMKMKGLNTAASNRSINMMFLLNYVSQLNNGKGVHLFTGTPITNSLNEIYNMMRYVMPQEMKKEGIHHWDSWFNTFADEVTDVEVTPAGDYMPVSRLSSFVNVPELRLMAGQYMDTVFAEDMPEFKDRTTKNGKTTTDELTESERMELMNGRTDDPQGRPYKVIRNEVAEMTPVQKEIRGKLQELSMRFRGMTGKEKRDAMLSGDESTPIRVETSAANAGLDARLYDKNAPDDPGSKVNRAISRVVEHYQEHEKSTQVIFMERGYSDYVTRTERVGEEKRTIKIPAFNLAKHIVQKLSEQGIPEDQIRIVDGSVSKQRRKEIADAMNRGEVRVVIGSTDTLGTGVNMQTNLRAMHHLDAPWMPGQLEQRNGRGHRQGNKWNTVLEYRYITEGIDGRRWQVLVVKDRFIKSFMKSKGDKRIIEGDAASIEDGDDGGDLVNTLSDATGDPRIMQLEKAKRDIDKLERRKQLHIKGIRSTRERIESDTQWANRLKQVLSERKDAQALLDKTKDAPFTIEIMGETYTERKDAEEAILKHRPSFTVAKDVYSSSWGDLGSFRGFPMKLRNIKGYDGKTRTEIIAKAPGNLFEGFDTSAGSLRGLESQIRTNPKRIEEMVAKISELEQSVERLKGTLDAPFQQEDKLAKAIARREYLESDIQLNPVPAPAWLRQGAPVGADVMYKGETRYVTGHMWNDQGWYVMLEGAEGQPDIAAPYMEVLDDQSIPLYEEREFEAPEIIEVEDDSDTDASEQDGTRFRTVDQDAQNRPSELSASELAESKAMIREMLGNSVSVETVDRLTTPEGREALGKYRAAWITLVEGKAGVKDTANHEAVHAALDLFLNADERMKLLNDVRKDGMTDIQAEEALAEEFVKYARDRSGFRGALKRVAAKVLRALRKLVTGDVRPIDRVNAFYEGLASGQMARATQAPVQGQTGMQTAQAFRDRDQLRESQGYVIGPVTHGGQFDAIRDDDGVLGPWTHFGTRAAAEERAFGSGVADGYLSGIEVFQLDEDTADTFMGEPGQWAYEIDGSEGMDVYDSEYDARQAAEEEALVMAENTQMEDDDVSFTDVYLRGNYKRMPDLGTWGWNAVAREAKFSRKAIDRIADEFNKSDEAGWEAMTREFERQGYDGIVYVNAVEDKGSDSYIVFRSNNAKSVDAEEFNPAKADIRHRENDTAYLAAVESGDMETAQRMVDEAARAAGYTVGPVFHGGKFNANIDPVFKMPAGPQRKGKWQLGFGTHFAETQSEADAYLKKGGETQAAYLDENVFDATRKDTLTEDELSRWPDSVRKRIDAFNKKWNNPETYAFQIATALDEMAPAQASQAVIDAGYAGLKYEARANIDNRVFRPFDAYVMVDKPSYIKSADPVTRDDTGRVIPLSERFNPASDDIRYRTEEQAEETARLTKSATDAWKFARDVWEMRNRPEKNARNDISKFDRLARTISHYAHKVPGLQTLFDLANKMSENKHLFGEMIFGEKEVMMGNIRKFSRKNKQVWKEKVEPYLWERDRNADGYTVEKQVDDRFAVRNFKGEIVEIAKSEDLAWLAAFAHERNDLVDKGFSPEAAGIVEQVRTINHNAHKQLEARASELRAMLEGLGLPPTAFTEDGEDLYAALRRMGDLRGSYMPRLRGSGRYMVRGVKDGKSVLEIFDTPIARDKRAVELEREGWTIERERNDRPADNAIAGVDIANLNDVITSAVEAVRRGKDTNIRLDSFGVTARRYQYKRKDGTTEEHLIVRAPQDTYFSQVFKANGAGFWQDKATEETPSWHFINPGKGFERELALDMHIHEFGRVQPVQVFEKMVTQQVAQFIQSRGSRSRKISRSVAKGDDVPQGYELDAVKAIAASGHATAGGSAKAVFAKSGIEAITGTDVDWDTYRTEKQGKAEFRDENGNLNAAKLWRSYMKRVEGMSIDSGTQPEAYADALSYYQDILRNDEPSERVIGTIKGIASLKFLTGVAPGVVNLTALLTNVPAAMTHFGNIPMKRSVGLVSAGVRDYSKHMIKQRWGKGSGVDKATADLLDEITERGWDEALMNTEAISVLQSKVGRGTNRAVEIGMAPFIVTEKANRAGTILAAYRGLEKSKPELSHEDKMLLAKEISDKAHGIYGKTNLPGWARGAGLGPQVLRMAYMYKTFSHNYLQILGAMGYDSFFGQNKADARKAFAYLLLSPAALGGGAATLAMPAAGGLANLFAAMTGGEPPDDFEEEFYRWVEGIAGERVGRVARQGAPSLIGINLKGSLALDIRDVVPRDLEELTGATGSMMTDLGKMVFHDFPRGEFARGIERGITPRAVSNMLKAYREYTQGATTNSGAPVYYGDEVLRPSGYEAVLRALSFNPSDFSAKRERQWKEYKVWRKFTDERSVIYSRLRRWSRNGMDPQEWGVLVAVIEQYNAKVRNSPFQNLTYITPSTLKSQLTRASKAPRTERIRSGEVEREDPGEIDFNPSNRDQARDRRNRTRRDRNRRTIRRERRRR
jgi:N12 class adenine-specific DNA methylase